MTLFLVVSGYCFLESTTAVKPCKMPLVLSFYAFPYLLPGLEVDLKVVWDRRGGDLVTVGIQHQGEALQSARLWLRIEPEGVGIAPKTISLFMKLKGLLTIQARWNCQSSCPCPAW